MDWQTLQGSKNAFWGRFNPLPTQGLRVGIKTALEAKFLGHFKTAEKCEFLALGDKGDKMKNAPKWGVGTNWGTKGTKGTSAGTKGTKFN